MVETKNRAVDLAGKLDAMLDFPDGASPPRIHWTGCPNSCGQAQVGVEWEWGEAWGEAGGGVGVG